MDVVRGSQHLLDERGGGLLAVTCSTCCFLSKDVLLRRATREKLLITTETPNKRTLRSTAENGPFNVSPQRRTLKQSAQLA